MSGRSKRDSRGSTRVKRESESRVNSGRVKRERDREREAEAPSSGGSPVRVKREVEPVSAREAPAPVVPAARVKREREADEDSEPEREVRGARGEAGRELYSSVLFFLFPIFLPPGWGNPHFTGVCYPTRLRRNEDSTSLNNCSGSSLVV